MAGARSRLQTLRDLFARTAEHYRETTMEAFRFDYTAKMEKELFSFRSVDDLEKWVVGSDADIGGVSEAYWGLTPERTGLFWGTLSTQVPAASRIDRSGYAGIRSKQLQPLLFHQPTIDVSMYRYLAIRARGDHHQWFVNIQGPSFNPVHLWQHRFRFKKPKEWETIMIPFRQFLLTGHGNVLQFQQPLDLSLLRTIGFSIVGQPGEYHLEVDWVKAMNTPQTIGDMDVRTGIKHIE